MVKDIGLNTLVLDPRGGIGKAVQLQRDAFMSRCQLAHHQRHTLMDFRMRTQVTLQIGSETAQIGQPAAVDQTLFIKLLAMIVLRDLFQFGFDVRFQQLGPG